MLVASTISVYLSTLSIQIDSYFQNAVYPQVVAERYCRIRSRHSTRTVYFQHLIGSSTGIELRRVCTILP